ncbi:MAG TPA: hypothetical protein VFM90_05310 [Cyclobacteriaceae bacterium]|nr:hypothetical protein [Cyclobacteriaceae bacterium]
MFLNNLFSVDQLTTNASSVEAVAHIDKNHQIFEGHFPGQPVVPGVCMLHLVKELLEQWAGKNLRIQSAANIKFLSIIDPAVNDRVHVSIQIEQLSTALKITASLFAGDVTFFKLKAVLNPA